MGDSLKDRELIGYFREQTIRKAVEAADKLILESTSGGKDTNRLTARVALALMRGGLSSLIVSDRVGTYQQVIQIVTKTMAIVELHQETAWPVRNWLRMKVALCFAEKATAPIESAITRYDLTHDFSVD